MLEATVPPTHVHLTAFLPAERAVLDSAVTLLTNRDFTVSAEMAAAGFGPHMGLTNEAVSATARKLADPTLPMLDMTDLWVLYAGTVEVSVSLVMQDSPVARAVRPSVDRVRGKLLQLRGFENNAVQKLLSSGLPSTQHA